MKIVNSTLVFLLITFSASAQYVTIATDPSGDANGGLDGTTLEYKYEQSTDKVYFRVTSDNIGSFSSGPAADFSFQLPNGLESGNPSGTHWTSSTQVHKTAYIYCDAGGSAPSSYTFNTWSLRIEETSTQNILCNNCVEINVDVTNKQLTYIFNRTDIITDSEMGGNSVELKLVVNVGHDVMWDDNITEDATFTITKTTTSVRENSIVSKLKVFPNPVDDQLNILGNTSADRAVIYDVTGKIIGEYQLEQNSFIDVA